MKNMFIYFNISTKLLFGRACWLNLCASSALFMSLSGAFKQFDGKMFTNITHMIELNIKTLK